MPTVDGYQIASAVQMENPDVASNILTGGALDFLTQALVPSVPLADGAIAKFSPIAILGTLGGVPRNGFLIPTHGDYWFERIHYLPAAKHYPFILSPQHLFVEVYNAWRRVFWSVDAILEAGPAGVSILTPYVLPINFYPLQSRIYDILVDSAGPPRADNTIRWDFDGTTEPTLLITGLRLLPFTISPDWDKGIDDVVAFATDVMVAYDDSEQRMMLREVPNRSLAYTASALDDREAGLLASLIWAWQARSYGVLLWMDAAKLNADMIAGALDLSVDTSRMGLSVGATVILIEDAFYWFASPVLEFTANSIKLETPVDRDFAALRTQVIPVLLGRVAEELPMNRPTNASAILPVKFDIEVVPV